MKIKTEDYNAIKEKIVATVSAWPKPLREYAEEYRATGRSDKRFRWDVAHVSKIDICALYHYMNDRHIDTALKRIIQEII